MLQSSNSRNGENQGYMYFWDESTASRGSQEISSCLTKYLQQNSCKNVIIYSDICGGQVRSINVNLSLMTLTPNSEDIDTTDLKLMVSGHSYLPNDAEFGNIEHSAKNKIIYTPDDWCRIIMTCRKANKFLLVKIGMLTF